MNDFRVELSQDNKVVYVDSPNSNSIKVDKDRLRKLINELI